MTSDTTRCIKGFRLHSHKNVHVIEKPLNEELPNLKDWCKANKPFINLKKNNFMVFKPRQKGKHLISI